MVNSTMRQRTAGVFVAVLFALAVIFAFFPPLLIFDPGEYETTTVSLVDENGSQLGTVDVRVADTASKRYVGLSRTDSLANGSGMLFVHFTEASRSYVMRNMSFPLDIVFIAANGTVTRIHHASVPERGDDGPYRGTGKYVLEVPRGWTNATGLDVGDTVRIPGTPTAEADSAS
jgi:uncharacterized membrane protein (UPF0127 family)